MIVAITGITYLVYSAHTWVSILVFVIKWLDKCCLRTVVSLHGVCAVIFTAKFLAKKVYVCMYVCMYACV